jgi:hypothetical protein
MSSAAHTVVQSEEERSRAVKRALLFVALGIIGFIASCTGVHFLYVFVSTADSADVADRYLTALGADRASEAYRLTSSTFREEQGPEAFADVMDAVSVEGHELMSWESRTLDHNRFNIYTGALTTESGRTLPFIMEVVQEDGEWRVQTLTGPGRQDVGPGAWFRQVPKDATLKRIVRQTMLDFDASVRDRDLRRFYDTMWTARTEISYWKFEGTFQEFLDDDVDLSGVQGVEPEFVDPPKLDRTSSGILLVLNGKFDAEGGQVPFTFRYKYKHPIWLLFNINVGRPGDPTFVLAR